MVVFPHGSAMTLGSGWMIMKDGKGISTIALMNLE